MNYEFSENKKGRRREEGWEGGHYPIKPSPLIINKNKMSSKIDYAPVEKTGVLSSSVYENGNILVLGGKTHLALIEGGNKFAALEVVSATDKDGNPCLLSAQGCEDGNFSVIAISALKTKKVFSADDINSARRLSGGMSIAEILALEAGIQYKVIKTPDGFKKPFGWKEGDPLQQNNSYRLEAVAIEQPTTKNK